MLTIQEMERTAIQVRRDLLRMIHAVQSGHPGGSLGCADFFTALYFEVLIHNPKRFTMNGEGQDVFFLSNGHLSAAWYSVLARSGYFDVSELATFRKYRTIFRKYKLLVCFQNLLALPPSLRFPMKGPHFPCFHKKAGRSVPNFWK